MQDLARLYQDWEELQRGHTRPGVLIPYQRRTKNPVHGYCHDNYEHYDLRLLISLKIKHVN